ncbi:MAG: hypothetical protein ACLP36_00555 [Acidimicrobiales bacterium]
MNVPDDHGFNSKQGDEAPGPEVQQPARSEPTISQPRRVEHTGSPGGPLHDTGATARVATDQHTGGDQYREGRLTLQSNQTSLRDLLAGYDSEVEEAFREALESTTGSGRVRVLHNTLRPSISVHDAVVVSALCPMLGDLPGGQAVADRLRQGCEERAELLGRFEAASHNVAAQDVYRVAGEEIEQILEGLERSFSAHAHHETTEVGDLLELTGGSLEPDVVAARMAMAAEQAPTRAHGATVKHPTSVPLRKLYRNWDRWYDWSDAHRGWSGAPIRSRSPRAQQVDLLKHQAVASPPSVRDLLAGYDATVEAIIEESAAAGTDSERAEAAHRLNAAVTIHDSVLGGVLCPLLEAVPGGAPLAARIREGCRLRAELQQSWEKLSKRTSPENAYRQHSSEAEGIIASLIESFRCHETEETLDVTALLKALPDKAYRTKTSPFADAMWPWYSQGPGALALHMALWAESAPTRVHPLMVRHPTSRILRSLYHWEDYFRDYWGDTALGRWLAPELPAQPFAGKSHS